VKRALPVLLVLVAVAGRAEATVAPDSLEGLWQAELYLGSQVRGELRVTRDGANLRAAIAGIAVRVEARGESLQLVLPERRGRFRGAWRPGHEAISGFWIQPPGQGLDQSFASPLILRSTGPHAWRGTVAPLEDRFTLWLSIFRSPEDSLVAVFRNPEFNSSGGAARFRVLREGDSLRFFARPDTTRPQIRLTAAVAGRADRLRLYWPQLGRVIELARPSEVAAAAFYPRPPGSPPYDYRSPATVGDGWATARASQVGMDEDSLSQVVRRLASIDPSSSRPALIHSLLIAMRGKLVLEEYFFGFDRNRVHDTRSAAKTFASVLLGVAMRQRAKITPETRIYDLLAPWGPFEHPDPRKARITLAHLMTHTSGLACDENDDSSPGNEDLMQGQRAQPNWWKYALDLPMAQDPGPHYAYCSGGMNLVGAALSVASGRWVPELFDETIARPLEFGPYYWNLMPTMDGYLGGGVQLRPRDLLKLGQLYLDGGTWHGHRIVDSTWVTRSTTSQVVTGERSADGYAWHLNVLESGDRRYREYEANGNGGQFVIVVPELELSVVFTAGNFGQYGIWRTFRDQILAREIIPAIRGR
jgi:CubicO group peptidase (beta-lactamase class C family)